MTVGLSDRAREIRRATLIAFGVVVATFQLSGTLGLRINTSPSLPMGLYIATADAGANMVEFCPAEPFATLAIIRGYRDPGNCRDGAAPLLKPVVAKSGDMAYEIGTFQSTLNAAQGKPAAAAPGFQIPRWRGRNVGQHARCAFTRTRCAADRRGARRCFAGRLGAPEASLPGTAQSLGDR